MNTNDTCPSLLPDPQDGPADGCGAADDRDVLIGRYLDGLLTVEEALSLKSALRDDPRAREQFVEAVDIHAMLAGSATLAGVPPDGLPPVDALQCGPGQADRGQAARPRARPLATLVSPASNLGRQRAWLLGGAAFMVAAAVGLVLVRTQAEHRVEIVRAVGDRYAANSFHPRLLERCMNRPIALDAGLLEIAFHAADATVVVEAPARFRVVDSLTLQVDSGRVTAHVRNADAGLRVLTPQAELIDRGTRFAVDVPDGKHSEVHVFEGQVDATTPQRARAESLSTSLSASEAARITSRGGLERRDLRDATFVQPEEILPLVAGLTADRRAGWKAAAAALKRDATLLAWIDFDRGEPGLVVDGARTVQGRFPGESAAEFVDADDNIGIGLNAVASHLTLMAWVRLDRVPEGISSLYHTDSWNTPGQVHWMILNNGQMRFAVQGVPVGSDTGVERWPESRQPLLNALGRWMHLAVVYDAESRQVRFHTNGTVDSTVELPTGLPAVLGSAQIGNWNLKQHSGTRHRQLSGRIDELVILARALADDEIHAHYLAGKPYAE
jgi:hypothetical protein